MEECKSCSIFILGVCNLLDFLDLSDDTKIDDTYKFAIVKNDSFTKWSFVVAMETEILVQLYSIMLVYLD